jgi:hypothetical protein
MEEHVKNESKSAEVHMALSGLEGVKGNQDLVEEVMRLLDSQRLLHYSTAGEVDLFSTPGRVLYTLMEDPTITHRALAVYLDLSENMIERTIKTLIEQGLITKTKYERKNVYAFNDVKIKNHPDIRRLQRVISAVNRLSVPVVTEEDEPF